METTTRRPNQDTPAEWTAFWDGLYAEFPAIAPGPITSMSDLVIVIEDGHCVACGGYGYFVKQSKTFIGVTYRTNCLKCGGKGVKPADPRPRIAA